MHVDLRPWDLFVRTESVPTSNKMELVNSIISANMGMESKSCHQENAIKQKHFPEQKLADIRYDVDLPEYALLKEFIIENILPRMQAYARDLYKVPIKFGTWKGWSRTTIDGRLERPHYHHDMQVIAVYYLECLNGAITLIPPTFNYEKIGIDGVIGHPSNYTFSPKSGDLLIFPGHLRHYVKQHEPNLRISVPVDMRVYPEGMDSSILDDREFVLR